MPYLIKNDTEQLFLIDYSTRNGLFYKYYSSDNSSKNTILYSNSTEHYSATQDHDKKIHIACKNKNNQIIHLSQNSSFFSQDILLEDTEDLYKISNFKLINCNNKLYLFYTALNPNENKPDIIQHNIDEDNTPPQSLLTTATLDTTYECYTHDDNIYLLSISNENSKYELQLSFYDTSTNEWTFVDNLVSSPHPITYCNLCIDTHGVMHIVYTQNQYGQHIINYLNSNSKQHTTKQIHSCPHITKPIIFVYNDTIWVNWKERTKLKMIISTNNGDSFTPSTTCSIQEPDIEIFDYLHTATNTLCGRRFYGSSSNFPKLAILNQIDLDNTHFSSEPNNELKLYINSIKHSCGDLRNNDDYRTLLTENSKLKQTQQSIANQYEELSALAKKLQSEGKKWKNKYYNMDLELRTLKKKLAGYKSADIANKEKKETGIKDLSKKDKEIKVDVEPKLKLHKMETTLETIVDDPVLE